MSLHARGRKCCFILGPLLVVALLLTGLMPVVEPDRVMAASAGFIDLSPDDPALPFITYVTNYGMFKDYSDGTFRPMNFVSRAQMAKLLCQVKKLEPYTPKYPDFSDVNPNHSGYSYIEAAVRAGIMKGYSDGTFKPEALISRAQTAALLLNLTNQALPSLDIPPAIQDVNTAYWAHNQIAVCLDAGIMNTDNANDFAPDMPITRLDLAKSLALAMVLIPEMNQMPISTNLVPVSGLVTLTGTDGVEKIQNSAVAISTGITIKTGNQGKAELLFPDGSSILINPGSQLQIEQINGQRYIKQDGSTGIVIDSLNINLSQGSILGFLAAGLFYTPGASQSGQQAALPWYRQAVIQRNRVVVDMPSGQARVGGPLWSNEVVDGKCSASVLKGNLLLTGAEQTVSLESAMFSFISQSGKSPSNPSTLSFSEKNQWAVNRDWMNTTLNRIMANAPLAMTSGTVSGSIATPEQLQKSYYDLIVSYPEVVNNISSILTTEQDQEDQILIQETSLKNISVSDGTLIPSFDPGTLYYTLVVPDKVDTVIFTPTLPADQITTDHSKSHTTVNIDGVIMDSGQPSRPINLTPGSSRTVSIVVTAQDGNHTRTYVVAAVTPETYRYLDSWGQHLALPQVHARYATVDGYGNIYLADSDNNQIYKLDSSGKLVNKWGSSGSGAGQFDSPAGIAVDLRGFIYVVDKNNNRIEKFRPDGVFLAQWGSPGHGEGQLSHPEGLAIDSNNNLYVADWGNSRLQKYDSQGSFMGKWGSYGTGNGQFAGPIMGVAIDTRNNVYVVDTGNGRIQKFDASGNFLAKWGSPGSEAGQFLSPAGIAVDRAGNSFVTDKYGHRVQKFDPSGSFVGSWGTRGGGPGQFLQPEGITVDPSGNVYVTDASQRMQRFTPTGVSKDEWSFSSLIESAGMFDQPQGIVSDKAGNIYVVDTGNNRVQKFDSKGNFLLQWGGSGTENGQFKNPQAIAIDANGYLYVADAGNDRIQKFKSDGRFLAKLGGTGSGDGHFNNPCGLAFDKLGHLYVADTDNCRIQVFNINNSLICKWGSPGSDDGQFLSPCAVAVDSSGNVFVADGKNNCIQKFDSTGTFLKSWGGGGNGFGQFNGPAGVSVSTDGKVFVTDSQNNRVQKFDSQGTYITQWGTVGNGSGQLKEPSGITVSASGIVYVVDSGNARIQKFSLKP